MAEDEEFVNEGFCINVDAGDIVDTGSGPPTAVAIATAMWVPSGSRVNGRIVTEKNDGVA